MNHLLSGLRLCLSIFTAGQSPADAGEAHLDVGAYVSDWIAVRTLEGKHNRARYDDDACYTTRSNKTHITETRIVHYRWHPWYGRTVYVFQEQQYSSSLRLGVSSDSTTSGSSKMDV